MRIPLLPVVCMAALPLACQFVTGTVPTATQPPASQLPPTSPSPPPALDELPALPTDEYGTLPTQTPIPSLTPPPEPTEAAVLVLYDPGFGDGGMEFPSFMLTAYTEPDVAIYENGLMLVRDGGWFVQSQLSDSQMCRLLRDLNQALQYNGAYYNGTPTPEYGFDNGESSIYLAFSGDPVSSFGISRYEPDYLTDAALRPISLVRKFVEGRTYEPYSSPSLLVWAEQVDRPASHLDTELPGLEWPSLYQYPYAPSFIPLLPESEEAIFVVEGDPSLELLEDQGPQPQVMVIEEDKRSFVVFARALLPHESLQRVLSYDFGPLKPIPFEAIASRCGG